MKHIYCTLGLSLLMGGMALAGPVAYEKIVVPEPVCGPYYISGFGGASFYDDMEFIATSDTSGNQGFTGDYGRDEGWIAGLAFGMRTDTNWRFELELSHHQGDINDQRYFNEAGALVEFESLHGDVETTSVMLNAVKEFGMNRWRPYLGAGLGLSAVEADAFPDDGFAGIRFNETAFGYQFMGGVVYDLTECLQTYLEYRVSSHSDLEDARDNDIREVGDFDLGWTQHIILGARWYF